MALSVKAGTIAARTTTGSQGYTGIGFTPKALILFVTNRTSTGVTTSINQIGYGFSSASASRAVAITSRNGGTSTGNIDEESRMAAAAITMLNTFGSLHLEATLTSFDSDGFTLNFTTVTGSANLIGYIALGGSDLTDVWVGDFLTGTSTGDVDVTSPGFAPDVVVAAHTCLGTALPYTSRTGSRLGFGVGVSASERFASIRTVRDQILNTAAAAKQVGDQFLLGVDTSAAEDFVADYVGAISGGFRINISDAPASTVRVAAMALKGPQFSCGLETQRTSTGTKGTTVAGTPKAALFLAAAKTAGSTLDTATDAQTFIGAADGTNEVSIGGRTADNVATADVYCELDAAKAIVKSSISGTTLAECDATFSAGTVTLDWTTADAVATEFGYLTAADAAAGGTVNVAPTIAASSTVTAFVRRRRRIAPLVAATSALTAAITRRRRIAPALASTSTVQIQARRQDKTVAPTIASTSNVSVSVRRRRRIAPALAAASTVSCSIVRRRRVAAGIFASSALTIVARRAPEQVAPTVAATSSVSVSVRRRRLVGPACAATSTVAATVRRRRRVTAQVLASSSISVSPDGVSAYSAPTLAIGRYA